MIDLRETSGLPLTMDDSRAELPIRLDGELQPGELSVRTLADLRLALADPSAPGPDPAYTMYRGVSRLQGQEPETGRRFRFRYDVTVFPPGRLGRELLRTVGHYHLPVRPGAASYPEVYEVLCGCALFLLQRVDDITAGPGDVRVEDFLAIQAERGTKAMMLPDYGHWTVNATPEPLVVSNWICEDCESYYDVMARTRGACCHVVGDPQRVVFAWNALYRHRPGTLRLARPVDAPGLGLVTGRPIFRDLLDSPTRWRYLCEPDEAPVDLRSAVGPVGPLTPEG